MPPQSFWHWHQASRRIQRQLSACTTSALLLQAALHLLQKGGCNKKWHEPPPQEASRWSTSCPHSFSPQDHILGNVYQSTVILLLHTQEVPASRDICHHSDTDRNRSPKETLKPSTSRYPTNVAFTHNLSFVTMNDPLFKAHHSTCQWPPSPLTQEGLFPYSTLLSPAPSSCPLSPGSISIIYKSSVISPNLTKQGRNTADLLFPSSNYCSLFLFKS